MPRDVQIMVERIDGSGVDDYGVPVDSWDEVCRVYARCHDMGHEEAVKAGLQAADRAALYRIRSNSATRQIRPSDRININGAIWNITSIRAVARSRRGELDILAVMKVD